MNTPAHHASDHHAADHHVGNSRVRARLAAGPVTTRVTFLQGGSFRHGDTPAVMRSPGRPGVALVAALA